MENIIEMTKRVLTTTPGRWLRLTASLPVDLLTRQPAAGEWSALQCLQHLVDTERGVFPARVRYLLAGQDFPAFNPDSEGSQLLAAPSAEELAAEFVRLRAASLHVLADVTPQDLTRTARHSELGVVTLSELLHEWAGHDLMHTVQAERALMQPFIEGCGPWQVYFQDHIA